MIISWLIHLIKAKNAKEFDESNYKKMRNKTLKLKQQISSKK